MRKKGDDVSSWLEGCALPHHHKNLMVTLRFMKELGIQAQVVCQRPGTLIYVRGDVFHQVLNNGILLSEAVNVGGSIWNVYVPQPYCVCPKTAIRVIPRNRASRDLVTSRPAEFLDCEFRDCVNVAPNVTMARLHSRRHVVAGAGTFHACRVCPTSYMRKTALTSHMDSCHPPPHAEAICVVLDLWQFISLPLPSASHGEVQGWA